MKLRVLRQDHTIALVLALVFGLGLLAVHAVWPDGFGVAIAIAGVIGALVVLYEVRLTKRIAQAEFVRDLQSGFSSDQNICELWRKLLLKEEVTAEDRPLVSSYLTFFETLHLLLSRGSLDLRLTDDLFRNRFFTAVGNKGVLDTALIRQAGAFANIHNLIEDWHRHKLERGVPIHEGYYSYIRALTEAKGYTYVRLGVEDLPDLLELQAEVLGSLDDSSWLRANSEDMLEECLSDHHTYAFRAEDGRLASAAVLYDAKDSEESIKKYSTTDPRLLEQSVNLKLVLTAPSHRRAGLGRTLIELLEAQAYESGKREVLCTIHPKNSSSRALFRRLGYRRTGRARTQYGKRVIYARTLPSVNKRWAR